MYSNVRGITEYRQIQIQTYTQVHAYIWVYRYIRVQVHTSTRVFGDIRGCRHLHTYKYACAQRKWGSLGNSYTCIHSQRGLWYTRGHRYTCIHVTSGRHIEKIFFIAAVHSVLSCDPAYFSKYQCTNIVSYPNIPTYLSICCGPCTLKKP